MRRYWREDGRRFFRDVVIVAVLNAPVCWSEGNKQCLSGVESHGNRCRRACPLKKKKKSESFLVVEVTEVVVVKKREGAGFC
jgi:hypothetical protein